MEAVVRRKELHILFVAILCIVFIIALIIHGQGRERVLDEIVETDIQKVEYVLDEGGNEYTTNNMLQNLRLYTYIKYNGSLGSTVQKSWIFADTDKKTLFVITDVGNRNIIGITQDNKTVYYQKK